MTNVPTLGGLVFFLAMFTFIPFWSAFIISYASYRKLKAGVVGGLTGLIVYILTVTISLPLKYSFWIYGLVSGFIGGIASVAYLSKYYQSCLPTRVGAKNIFNRRNFILVVIVLVLLFSFTQYYSSARKTLEFGVTDPRDDLSHAGYPGQKLSGHDDIDIVRLESYIAGNNVILEMELAGEIATDIDAEYTFFIATDEQGLWTRRIDLEDMEKNGRILRGKIPVESLQNRKVFKILAVAKKPDIVADLALIDGCSNENIIESILRFLI